MVQFKKISRYKCLFILIIQVNRASATGKAPSIQNMSTNLLIFNSRIDGEEVRLMLWDTAGQEEFDAITKAYYRGAHACVLAFSTTDRDSFLALHSWKLKVYIT